MNAQERKYVADGLRTLASLVERGEFEDYEMDIQNGLETVENKQTFHQEPVLTGEKLLRMMLYQRPKADFKAQHDPYAEAQP